MKFVLSSTAFLVLFISQNAQAQLDSSYELLLGSSPHNSTFDTVTTPKKTDKKKRWPTNDETATNVGVLPVAKPASVPLPQPEKGPSATNDDEQASLLEEPSLVQQAQSLFKTDDDTVGSFYEKQFQDSDPRQNKIEISFAPGFVTQESASNFSYRNYRSVYTAMNLGANVWLTPAMGVGGNFMFSLGADTSGDAVGGARTPARYELLDLAIKFRKFFGFSPLSKSLQFDVMYSDSKMTVPSDDVNRARLKTSGVGAKMTLRLPSSKEVAWLIGGTFFPRVAHSEEKTGVAISSGNNIENTRLGILLGSEITLSQQSQIFYEMSATSERNLFDGTSSVVDPATGSKTKNVSVTNSQYLFTLGYRWGN